MLHQKCDKITPHTQQTTTTTKKSKRKYIFQIQDLHASCNITVFFSTSALRTLKQRDLHLSSSLLVSHLCNKCAAVDTPASSPSLSTLSGLGGLPSGLGGRGVVVVVSSGSVVIVGSGGVVVTTVVVICSPNSKLRAIIRRTTLRNRHENKLMVRRGSHSANTVIARRKSSSNSRREPALSITSIVDSLEEGELSGIEGSGGVQGVAEILDGDVGVADDLAALELLGGGVVGAIGVGEGSGYEVCHLDFDIEGRVSLDGVAALRWECDYGRDHVRFGGDVSHDCLVLEKIDWAF